MSERPDVTVALHEAEVYVRWKFASHYEAIALHDQILRAMKSNEGIVITLDFGSQSKEPASS